MVHTDRKYQKGNEYAYRIFNLTQEKILYSTLVEKYQKGLQISKSTNWTQSPVD